MNAQVNINLEALNADLHPSTRTLNLNADRRVIKIGRASKSPSKGLLGAADNAWFDSPVMSRNHAEILFDPEVNTVTIRDIGSMHGTYVDKTHLEAYESKHLSDGDTVVFGAEVKRGEEIFPACAFRITYEYSPYKNPTNTFAFPEDSSDIEQEYEFSDSFEEQYGPSSDDGVSIEVQAFKTSPASQAIDLTKASQAIHAIDLTRDDSPAASPTPEDNSTRETAAEKRLLNLMAGRPSDIADSAGPVNAAIYAGQTPILVESDEEGAFSTDSDDQSEAADSIDSDRSDGSISGECEDSEDSDLAAGVPRAVDTPREAGSQENQLYQAAGLPLGFAALVDQAVNAMDERVPISAPEDATDEDDNDDDESDFGLSEAGREGIKKLFDDGLLGERSGSPEMGVDEESEAGIAAAGESAFEKSQASHSEANRSSSRDSDSWRPIVAQSLGEKTGKHEFFAARDHNRAKLNAGVNESGSDVPSLGIDLQDFHLARSITATTMNSRKENVPSTIEEQPQADPETIFAIPSLSEAFDLDMHSKVLLSDRDLSPEPDMTSAVKFNESKASMAAMNKTAAEFTGRSRLSINDIIEESHAEQTPKQLKRKADDISDVLENEVRVWASSPAVDVLLNTTDMSASAAQVPVPEVTSNLLPDASQQRPVKRLKKLVEGLGYAALGGVAVGAGLFSVLVATAPEFL